MNIKISKQSIIISLVGLVFGILLLVLFLAVGFKLVVDYSKNIYLNDLSDAGKESSVFHWSNDLFKFNLF